MTENAEGNGNNNSVTDSSSLLAEISKLLFALNKQVVTVNQRLETMQQILTEFSGSFLDKLSHLDEITETSTKLSHVDITGLAGTVSRISESIETSSDMMNSIHKAVTENRPVITGSGSPAGGNIMEPHDLSRSDEDSDKSGNPAGSASIGADFTEGFTGRIDRLVSIAEETKTTVENFRVDSGKSASEHMETVSKNMKSLEDGIINALNETGEKHAGKMEKGLEKITGLIAPVPEKINDVKVSLTEKLSTVSDSIVEKIDKFGEGITSINKGISAFPGSMTGLEQRVIERIADVSQAGIESDDKLKKNIDSISQDVGTLSDKIKKSEDKTETSFSEIKTLLEVHREKIETSEVTELNDQAISHFNNAEYKLAEKSLKKAIKIDESRAEIWTNLGQIQAAMEKWKDSEESFRKALELDPELSPAMSGLGGLLVRTGRPDETIEFLRRFIENEKPAAWAMLTYSRALAAVDKHAEAVELLKKARELDPGNTEIEQEFRKYSDGQ